MKDNESVIFTISNIWLILKNWNILERHILFQDTDVIQISTYPYNSTDNSINNSADSSTDNSTNSNTDNSTDQSTDNSTDSK